MWVYFDASALVKRYSSEVDVTLINEIFQQISRNQMTCSTIGVLEMISILVRKRNDGRLPTDLYNQAVLTLNQELIQDKEFRIAPVNDDLLLSAIELIAKHNLNATDTVILRSCLDLRTYLQTERRSIFPCSCDKRLLRAAQQEGLHTFNPEVDNLSDLRNLLDTP